MKIKAVDRLGKQCEFDISHARGIGMLITTPTGQSYFVTRESLAQAIEKEEDEHAAIQAEKPDPGEHTPA